MEVIKNLVGKNFLNLFIAQLSTHFADVIIQTVLIAILIETLDKPGSAISLMFFGFMLPSLIVSIFAGTMVDKFSRQKIMSISSLYRSILSIIGLLLYLVFCKTSFNVLGGVIYSFLIGIGSAFLYPAKMALVPNVVENKSLKAANALISGSTTWAFTFGMLLASNILSSVGINKILVLASVLYFIPSILFMFVKENVNIKFNQGFSINFINDIKMTRDFLWKHKNALNMIILAVVIALISSAFYNTMNAFATDFYQVNINGLSKLKCMLGCGTIYGVIIMVLFGKYFKTNKTLVTSFVGLFFFLITASFCTTFGKASVWLAFIGIFATILKITVDTILQKLSPNYIRGKIFAYLSTLKTLVTLIGIAIISFIVEKFNPIYIFNAIALTSVIMAFGLLVLNKDFRYVMFRMTVGQIFKIFFKYKVEGIDNIPSSGKIILAGNHTGYLDALILQMATNRKLWFVTGPNAFKLPIIKHILKWYNVLPLKFGNGMDAINMAVNKLNGGEAVIIFPEGKLTIDNEPCRFHKGVSVMAKMANSKIIPFAIKGGFEAWGKNRKLPKLFTTIIIQFGQPITNLEEDENIITKDLEQRVKFMKTALEKRVFYNIEETKYTNFLDIMKQYSDTYGQTKAVSLKIKNGYEEISYIDLKRRSKKFANYMMENADVQRGDRIAILSESRPEFAVGIFASIQTGAITVPLDVKLTVPEHTHILSDCMPKILLCSAHYLEHAIELKNNVSSIEQIYVLNDEEREHKEILSVSKLDADIEKSFKRARSMDETAIIVYTSGTTGNPKGVMISFGNIYSQMRDFEKILKLTKDNTLLSILPLNHLLELNVGFFGMLFMGAKIVYIKSLNPKELTSAMKEKQVSHMIIVPLVAKMLKNSIEKQIKKQPKYAQKIFDIMYKLAKFMPLKVRRMMFKSVIDGFGGKLECFISGGAPLESDVAEFFNRIGMPAFEGYGLTETSPVISTNRYNAHKIGTVGKSLPSVCVKLSEQGEILVQGPNVMQGYYNRPEVTAEVIDENGWFHTGDIGEIDKQGFIKITGRIKNMIVLGGGKKIFPEEVEAVLETSNLIKELCVLSLKIKSGNKAGTEEVGVIIVPSDELAKKDDKDIQKILENEVKKLSEENLAPYKTPTTVVFRREELPKTSTQKVKRKDLLKWYEEEYIMV